MLHISKKTDYGLLFLATLAKDYPKGLVTLATIAEQNHLPLPFMRQLAIKLTHANIIKSKEGQNGGYKLARHPSTITMSEVVSIFEGRLAPVSCLEEDHTCPAEQTCTTKKIWSILYSDMLQKFKTTTLEQLL